MTTLRNPALESDILLLNRALMDRPRLGYRPHNGQIQFHRATHTVRCLWPGNRFGKTRAMGTEVAWWVSHTHPYQATPRWPVVVIWFCQKFQQFDIMRAQLESECFDTGWSWNDQKHRYEWPGGDKVYVVSCDADWRSVQGINPDLVCYDEEPPSLIWREMWMRQAGTRATKYLMAATATGGWTWMADRLYTPWAEHHRAQGLDEQRAMMAQTHPWLWAWPSGGHADNPHLQARSHELLEIESWRSASEKAVRMHGGFRRFTGDPVFDFAALERMLAAATPGKLAGFKVQA